MSLVAPLLLFIAAVAQDSEADRLKKEVEKLKADQTVMLRQLEVAQAQLKELNESLDKNKYERARDETTRTAKDLLLLEQKQVEARTKKAVEEQFRALEELSAAYAARPQGKVTAVANEIGLVVISIGTDDGVKEGDEFVIQRSGEFVAKMKIDRADRKWSAGKILLRKGEPRVADAVSNQLQGTGSRVLIETPEATVSIPRRVVYSGPVPPPTVAAPTRGSADDLRSLRKELDDVRLQVRQLTDRLVPSWQDAGVSVEDLSEELRSHLGISRGLLIRRVREGSAADNAGLKANDVVPNATEAQLLDMIAKRLSISIIRKGQQITPK